MGNVSCRRGLIWLGWFAMVLGGIDPAGGAAPAPPAAAIPVEDFFRPPLLESPELNQTGTYLAGLTMRKDDHQVAVIINLDSREKTILSGAGDHDVYSVNWLDDRRLLMSQSTEKLFADALFVADVAKLNRPYVVERYSVVELVGVPRRRPLQPILWLYRDAYTNGRDQGPVRIDASQSLDTEVDGFGGVAMRNPLLSNDLFEHSARIVGTYPPLTGGPITDLVADQDGELAFAVISEGGQPVLMRLQSEAWVRSPVALQHVRSIAAGDRLGEVWVSGTVDAGKPCALLRMNAQTGAIEDTIYQDNDYDCSATHLIRNPQTRKIVGFTYTREGAITVWLDKSWADRQRGIDGLFPDLAVSVVGIDAAEKRMVVCTSSDRSPAVYYSVDLTKGRVAPIASSAPWIVPERMRPMQVLRFKTRDAHLIEGYLTLPEGAAKENPAPLVVLPHGGPWVRDSWGWNPEVQFLASRGYAVFQPNYRGSTGTQWRFPEEDQWAFLKMHQDVTDGVRALLRTGLVDPQRVAIMGSSFGGYLALSGAANEPELYRCAVTIAGVYDWELMMRSARRDLYDSIRYQVYKRSLGDPRRHREEFDAISPLRHIARVKCAIFVAHGRADQTVDVNQSRKLIQELEKCGVPHESLIKSGEGHGMSRLSNQVELYTAIERFLARHLAKPASTAK